MALSRAAGPAVDVVRVLAGVVAGQLASPTLRARPLVIVGPSGVGKSYSIRELCKCFPNDLRLTVSTTTRQPRGTEAHGVEYYFVSPEAFRDDVVRGAFIEHDTVHGNSYGTTVEEVLRVARDGHVPIMDMTIRGAAELSAACAQWQNKLGLPAPYVAFVAPPSMEELGRRLRSRETESEEQVVRRLAQAEHELTVGFEEHADIFDVVLKKLWT
mmetsp:Transcript_12254/g.31383  ORF Transcript_12254/g.31383 Transcript_12254/m.31383 type:complete len:214 (+) Transcript_12254:190-831(+)